MYTISSNTRTIENGKDLLVANVKTDKFLKVTKIYYDILKEQIEEKGEIESLLGELKDNIEKENFTKLLENLVKTGVVIDKCEKSEIEKLESAYIICTNRCNLKCIHCSKSAGPNCKDKLSTKDIQNIIDNLVKYNPETIVFSGGEPLCRNDMISLLKYTRNKYKGNISFATNGLLINDNNINEIIKCVDSISVSLDGVDEESCSKIRGKGVFKKAIYAIKLLKEKKFKKISASMLITPDTEEKQEKFKELCKGLNITPLLRRFTPIGRGAINKERLMTKNKGQAIEVAEKFISCMECKPGEREICINFDGDVFPCQALTNKEFCLGNILEKPDVLYRLFKGDNAFMKEKVDKIRPYNQEKCKNCKVNLFCWSCLSNYQSILQDESSFNTLCKVKKAQLEKIIW